jgi:hypothetical protein
MTNSFLDYYKTILTKVSFDRNLFQKEYNKAMNTLDADAAIHLRQWLVMNGLVAHADTDSQLVSNETVSANTLARPY